MVGRKTTSLDVLIGLQRVIKSLDIDPVVEFQFPRLPIIDID